MLQTSRRQRKAPPTPKRISLDSWKDGYQSTRDANRTGKMGLQRALNQILKQDGTVSQRPSLILYGEQPTGTILGEVVEFTKRTAGTSLNYELCVMEVSGTANVYYRKDGEAWTLAPGKTYNTTARAHPCPIRDIDTDYNDEDKVLILNGEDNLSYFDINTFTVIPFVALTASSINTLTVGAGLTGTNFTHYYKVTAGNRGETAASTQSTATTTKARSEWSGATEYIDVVINRVTGASRYHIYYSTSTGQEAYLFSIDDPGSGTTVTWRDSGTADPDANRPAPAGDTTAGPICTRATFINGQVFMVGDKVNPKYVRYGGTGNSILDFSPYGGGGYNPVGGNKEIPVKVAAFRNNSGSPAITVLCKGTNGFGKRYIMSSISEGTVTYFGVSEENGNDGTEAPDSVILAKDQLWYLSRDGGKTTLTKAQVQTILSTEGVTDDIRDDIQRLNTDTLDLAWGLHWEGRNYWGVAAGSTTNNQIWILDLNDMRRGAWMMPWEIAADWGWLYNDNNGDTHFCVLVGGQIFEFTDAVATQDNGVAFPTGGATGILRFSDDGQEWAIVLRVIFVVQRPQGIINVAVNGKTEDSSLATLGTQPFQADTDLVGWGEAGYTDDILGWSEIGVTPSQYGIDRTEIEVEIDEELQWLSCEWGSLTANTAYELTDIIVEYIPSGTKD